MRHALGPMLRLLKDSRKKTLDQAASARAFENIYYSGSTYALWRAAGDITRRCSKGLVLDAGSGRGAWKDIIEIDGARRESVDIDPKAGEQVTWVADLTDMPQVPSDRYDACICHQVFEHLPRPAAAAAELYRTLKPGGVFVISAPHLSRQHELPHDYFRFTPGGLSSLLKDVGFEVETVVPFGGLLTFIHHQISTIVLGMAALTKPSFYLATIFNAPFSVLTTVLDRLFDRQGLLANGILVVARKPSV